MPPPKNKKPKDEPTPERKVVYDSLSVMVCAGADALTSDLAKQLLGWREVADKDAAVLTDRDGKHVVFDNNTGNRPFYPGLCDGYVQEILQRRWRLNGETIVVGRHGSTISGQHRLPAVVLAEQDRRKDPHWKKNWPGPVSIETLVVRGVDESDEVVNTLDTGKSRSDADVIYRGPWFADKPSSERRSLARAAGHAVRQVWSRTGLDGDPFAPLKSVTETTDFLCRHPRLVEAVKHLCTENSAGSLSKYLSVGYAAGMMYLMAAGRSDPEKWRNGHLPDEKDLDLSDWTKAETFWSLLGNAGSPDLRPVREAKSTYRGIDEEGNQVDREVYTMADESPRGWRLATICRAWNEFVLGNKLTPARVSLPLRVDGDGLPQIVTGKWMTVGGIDSGGADSETEDGDGETGVVTDESAGVEARKEEVKADKAAKKTGPADDGRDDPLSAIRRKYPDHVLFVKVPKQPVWTVVGGKDVKIVSACGCQVQKPGKQPDGTVYARMFPGVVDDNADKLVAKGHKVAKVFDDQTVRVYGEVKKTKSQKADDEKAALVAAEDAKLAATKKGGK